MEKITLCFTIISVIYMALTYLRLGDIDHNATVNTNLIRRDIVDHDSHISTAVSDCALQVSDMEKNLTTEIACLATKNNEDIKRMGGKFEKWDLIKLDEKDLLITDIEADGDGNVKVHCINNKGMPYTYYRDAPAFKNYARFIKHSVSPFDEQEVTRWTKD